MLEFQEKKKSKRVRANFSYSIISVSMVLFLMGIVGLLGIYGQNLVKQLKESVTVMVELSDGITGEALDKILRDIKKYPAVLEESVRYIKKQEALELLVEDFGEEILSLDLPNPLFDVISFNVQASYVRGEEMEGLKSNIKNMAPVQDVHYQNYLVYQIEHNFRRIGLFLVVLCIILIIVAAVLINNTVRLALYSNRFLIKNMELVGATWSFITRPYLKNSIWVGVGSATIAMAGILIFWAFIRDKFPEMNEFHASLDLFFLFLTLVIAGILLTYVSTYFSVKKYLRLRLEDLF